jgi:hypothetical protein
LISAWMPAMMGEAKEVPPAPDHALGSAPQVAPPFAVFDQQKM